MDIKIIKDKISIDELKELAQKSFGDMVKAVVDIEQKIMAVGCSMHSDAESLLLRQGSRQQNLWGINIFPNEQQEAMIEYTSLINIRPKQNNLSMNITEESLRNKIKEIVLL